VTAPQWRPVPGYSGYWVSDHGDVASTRRGDFRHLKLHRTQFGHVQVWLYSGTRDTRKGVGVHRLVLLAFVGEPEPGQEACHNNDVPADNRLSNLRWGTHTDNMQDRLRNGRNPFAMKTHCKRGHEFTPENTRVANGARHCRECARLRQRSAPPRVRDRRRRAVAS